MADLSQIELNGTTYDLKDAKARMVILSYGSSTWNDFIDAYTNNTVVYCRASSNSNPASGSQTRLAFMAYVNNAATPTEVEFQYYRSVSSHTDSQQGDQVYVYKLQSNGTWSVTTRDAFTKVIAGTGLTSTFSTGVHSTITLDSIAEPATEAPLANMDAVVGTSTKYAREDHRHPATKIPSIWCDTLSGESAKVANGNSGYYYFLREGNLFTCEIYYGNTAQSALTFRVGTTGAKPIYINGTASSSTNYTLPAGSYIVYYDGTAYHFRTDGKIPGPITNNATSSAAGLMSAADKSKLDVITGVAVTDTEPTSDNILAWIDTDSTDTVTLLTQSEVNAQYVSYDHAQTLTSAQQNRALQNVGVTNGTDAQKTNLATFAGISLTVVGTI